MSRVVATRRATLRQKDPTRTAVILAMYQRALLRKLAVFQRAIITTLDDRDVFGLKRGLLLHVDLPPEKAYQHLDLPGKNRAFAKWLEETIRTYVLEDTGLADAAPGWIQTFIRAAYTKGAGSALRMISKADPGVKELTLQSLLNVPFHRERLAQLFDRNFTELKGFTSSMSTRIQRAIADGLTAGDNPRSLGKRISDSMKLDRSRATTIVRTEIIRTNAEAQLNTFERFGVKGVQLEAEWITAEDDRVCPDCEDMNNKVFSIEEARGLIPLHPNCRCNWLPVRE
jgi:SPP1 gp7 family putative phage head morphogenesis protein